MAMPGVPAAGYKFNTFQEIKSHSSILYNERMAILFYLLDMKSMEMNTHYRINEILEVRAIIRQIYKNIRTLIRNNPTMRATLNLETKDAGIYITDVALGIIDKMIEYCEMQSYTTKRLYIIIQELNNLEMLIKDILQYYHYFIRPEFRQKPDVEIATEKYKEIADVYTIDELRSVIGKKHRVDFEGLGTSRVDLITENNEDENDNENNNENNNENDNEDDEDEDNKSIKDKDKLGVEIEI